VPTAGRQRRLRDDVGAVVHERARPLGGGVGIRHASVRFVGHDRDRAALRGQVFEVCALVLEAALLQDREGGVAVRGREEKAPRRRQIERGVMPAGEMIRQVGRREEDGVVSGSHARSVPQGSVGPGPARPASPTSAPGVLKPPRRPGPLPCRPRRVRRHGWPS